MKKTVFLSVSLAGVVLLAACQNGTGKQKNADEVLKEAGKMQGANAGANNFEIESPSGWTRMDTTMQGLKATFLLAPEAGNGFRTNLNVITQAMNGLSGDAYYDASVDYMSKNMTQFKMVDKGTKRVAGMDAHYVHYNDVQNGTMMDQALYIIPQGNVAYLITCTTQPGDVTKYQPDFDKAIGSFKVH
jgi:hypothetical protein